MTRLPQTVYLDLIIISVRDFGALCSWQLTQPQGSSLKEGRVFIHQGVFEKDWTGSLVQLKSVVFIR